MKPAGMGEPVQVIQRIGWRTDCVGRGKSMPIVISKAGTRTASTAPRRKRTARRPP